MSSIDLLQRRKIDYNCTTEFLENATTQQLFDSGQDSCLFSSLDDKFRILEFGPAHFPFFRTCLFKIFSEI